MDDKTLKCGPTVKPDMCIPGEMWNLKSVDKQGHFKADPAIDVEQAGRGEDPKPRRTSLWTLKEPLSCVDSVWALEMWGLEIRAEGLETWTLEMWWRVTA